MANNQIDPNKESSQLSEEELETVAGGIKIPEPIKDAAKDFVGDVVDAGKELLSDVNDFRKTV